MQTPVFLEWDRYQLWVSLFYNRQSRDGKWLWFAASEVVPRVHRQDFFQEWDIIVYNKFIASYFLNRNWIFYATGEVTPTIGIKDAGGNQYFWYYGNFGLGAKYVWNNMLTFDLSHTRFLFGLTQGAGNTINLGIGLIK